MNPLLSASFSLRDTFRVALDDAQMELDALTGDWADVELVGAIEESVVPAFAAGTAVSIRFAPDYEDGQVSIQSGTVHVNAGLNGETGQRLIGFIRSGRGLGAKLYADIDCGPDASRLEAGYALPLRGLKLGLQDISLNAKG